jgi:hypothetical protein
MFRQFQKDARDTALDRRALLKKGYDLALPKMFRDIGAPEDIR